MSGTIECDYTDFPGARLLVCHFFDLTRIYITMPSVGHAIMNRKWAVVDKSLGDGSCLDILSVVTVSHPQLHSQSNRRIRRTRDIIFECIIKSSATPCERVIEAMITGAHPLWIQETILPHPRLCRLVIDGAFDPFKPLNGEGSHSSAEFYLRRALDAGFSPADRLTSTGTAFCQRNYLLEDSRPSRGW